VHAIFDKAKVYLNTHQRLRTFLIVLGLCIGVATVFTLSLALSVIERLFWIIDDLWLGSNSLIDL